MLWHIYSYYEKVRQVEVIGMEETTNAYRILRGKLKCKQHYRDKERDWKFMLKRILRKQGGRMCTGFKLIEVMIGEVGFCKHGHEFSDFTSKNLVSFIL
jgi:hypothetical protein